jgi:hypothetical protein
MTDQKPKIDLKARLGKKSVGSPSGHSIPPPTGIPRPSGIPAPPFGSRSGPTDPSNPYSSMDVSSAPARVEPQAIRVEMSEEVRQEQRKQSKKFVGISIATAIIGALFGYTVGSGHERGKVADQALRDAGELAKEVKDAMVVAENLADTVKNAKDKLSSSKFPEEEVNKLGGLRVPFGGDKLGGRNIGRFKKEVSSGLLALSGQAEKANDMVDTISRILNGSRKSLADVFAQGSAPKVMWAAYAEGGPHGPLLSMLAVPEPFPLKAEKGGWPDSIKFKVEGKDVSVKRYTKGDPAAGNDPQFIPVDPSSQGGVCPNDVVVRIARQLGELEGLIRGVKEANGHEETGMLDSGRAVEEKLRAIGTPG